MQSALAQAEAAGSREIFMSDPTFADWPLNDRAIVESLSRWIDSRCTLTLMAHGFDELARRQLRFVAWRQQWSHVVRCRSDPELGVEQVPTAASGAGPRSSCACSTASTTAARCRAGRSTCTESRETIDALLQRSEEAFPVTTLGL